MNEEKAREILGHWIRANDELMALGKYINWSPGEEQACLDGFFTPDELEAIAWWMRNKTKT